MLSPRDMWVKMEESVEVVHILHSSALLILITGDLTFIAYILLIFWIKCDSAHTVSFTASCYLLTAVSISDSNHTIACIFQPQIASCVAFNRHLSQRSLSQSHVSSCQWSNKIQNIIEFSIEMSFINTC